jgi:CRISPR-associated endoribonuclease Cas6
MTKKGASALVAGVFTLTVDRQITLPGHLARSVYRFWLQYIEEQDKELARTLHDKPALRPFTCSDLIGGRRIGKDSQLLQPDETYWFRITALTATTAALLTRLLASPPECVEIDGAALRLQQATSDVTQNIWAGETSYEALAAPYLMERRSRPYHITLEFVSPTAFRMSRNKHQKKRTWPVPMPRWVFGSLHRCWNEFSSLPMPDDFIAMVEESVVLSKYSLRTVAIPTKNQIPQMGCLGHARYVLIEKDEFWASRLHMLGDYAVYAGVGYQTTAGLGQTRVAEKKNE